MKKIKVGVIGCGTIGGQIAQACVERLGGKMELVGICDIDKDKAASLAKTLGGKVAVMELDALMKESDLVVEAASALVSAQVLEKAIRVGRNVLIMSVGGLLGHEELLEKAAASGINVYLPSGALCGIDGLKSSSVGRIDSVTLTTTKPPAGLVGAPYLKEKNIDVTALQAQTTVFEGSALEAIKGFPANVNVCAVLSLAGIGAKDTRVRIVALPGSAKNVHEVEIIGEAGRITARTENVPSKTNPKTSQLAVYSAIATLEAIAKSVRVGT